MNRLNRHFLAGAAALAVVAGFAALPAEAKTATFKPSFVAKFPGAPKSAASFKATVAGPIGKATGFIYNDSVGSLTLNSTVSKPGLTTKIVLLNVNVFGGMDLTGVAFPVTREALVVYSYTVTKISLKDPQNPKITAYNYSTQNAAHCNVTVTSYDAVKGELTGTLDGDLAYSQNIQDPTDDARDGQIVTLKGAKFALKSLN